MCVNCVYQCKDVFSCKYAKVLCECRCVYVSACKVCVIICECMSMYEYVIVCMSVYMIYWVRGWPSDRALGTDFRAFNTSI